MPGGLLVTRDLLIRLLDDEHDVYYNDDYGLYCCSCREDFGRHVQWAEHVADLILLGFAR